MLVREVSRAGELELFKGLESLARSLGKTRTGALADRDKNDNDALAGPTIHLPNGQAPR